MAKDYDALCKDYYRRLFQSWELSVETGVEVAQRARTIDTVVRCEEYHLARLRDTAFAFFRRVNAVEFKSVLDLLTLEDLNVIMSRAWALGALYPDRVDQLPGNRTVTIICVTRPTLILDTLRDELRILPTAEPGVYLNEEDIARRIIYPTELEIVPKNYPLLVLSKGEKLAEFFELAVREGLWEYVEVILEVGVGIDPLTVMKGVQKMAQRYRPLTDEERRFVQDWMAQHPDDVARWPLVRERETHAQQQLLLRMLRRKFPNLPPLALSRVEELTEEEELQALADRILTATTLDELQLTEA